MFRERPSRRRPRSSSAAAACRPSRSPVELADPVRRRRRGGLGRVRLAHPHHPVAERQDAGGHRQGHAAADAEAVAGREPAHHCRTAGTAGNRAGVARARLTKRSAGMPLRHPAACGGMPCSAVNGATALPDARRKSGHSPRRLPPGAVSAGAVPRPGDALPPRAGQLQRRKAACGLTSGAAVGFCRARSSAHGFHDHDGKDVHAGRSRGPHPRRLDDGRGLQGRPAGARRGGALLHRHPAAERHRLAAHGPRAQQHAAGRAVPLRAHARPRRAVAAGHRPRRHRHPDGGRAPADGAAGAEPARHGPRGVPRAGLGVEGSSRGGTIVSQLKRLGASCDWSRERFTMDEGLSRGRRARCSSTLYRDGPDLQGQAAGQLGPEAPDRDLRPRGRAGRGQGQPLALRLSAGRRARDRVIAVATTRPETMLGDTARRRASRRRALQGPGRQARAPAAGRPPHPDRRRRAMPTPRRAPARSRSRRRTTSTTSRSASATTCA